MSRTVEVCAIDDPAQEIAEAIDGKLPAITERPALIFGGQGSQRKGMGRQLAEAEPEAMALWKEAEQISGLPLREIYWDGEEEDMSDTRSMQPAISVVNLNYWHAMFRRHAIQPVACAGHSLGEFSAMACAGALSPRSVLEITSLRGRLMAEADPDRKGSMAAIVKLLPEQVMDIVREASDESGQYVFAANFNTPNQIVVSGIREAVQLACQKAKVLRGRAIELQVSGAFHTPMMEEANRELQPLLEKTQWQNPKFPIYCNVDARPVKDAESAKKSIWRQMLSPVYWVDIIRNLYLAGIRWWMEISPRAVLGKMVGPSLAGIASHCDDLRVDLINSLSSILNYTA